MYKIHGKILLPLVLFAMGSAALAHDACNDANLNKQWRQVLSNPATEGDTLALAFMRDEICQMVSSGKLSAGDGQRLWEQTLTKAYLGNRSKFRDTGFFGVYPRPFATF